MLRAILRGMVYGLFTRSWNPIGDDGLSEYVIVGSESPRNHSPLPLLEERERICSV
jgi:hypothetical protein